MLPTRVAGAHGRVRLLHASPAKRSETPELLTYSSNKMSGFYSQVLLDGEVQAQAGTGKAGFHPIQILA